MDEPTYRLVREDHDLGHREWDLLVEDRDYYRALYLDGCKTIDRQNLEIHRLDSEKQTEACCTGEMREDFQRQIEEQHGTIQKLNDEIGRLRETKDWALLTQLRDENRELHARINRQANIIQNVQHLSAQMDSHLYGL